MKIKTSELIGPALDWAVAESEGRTVVSADKVGVWCDAVKDLGRFVNGNGTYKVDYSTDWSQGGPIIERECINLTYRHPNFNRLWTAFTDEWDDDKNGVNCDDLPLIAAMRCYVASKLGDEVEVPDELA